MLKPNLETSTQGENFSEVIRGRVRRATPSDLGYKVQRTSWSPLDAALATFLGENFSVYSSAARSRGTDTEVQ